MGLRLWCLGIWSFQGPQEVAMKVAGVIPKKGPDIRDPESYLPSSHFEASNLRDGLARSCRPTGS